VTKDSLGRVVRERRAWSLSQKQTIVAECLLDGASVSAVARRHGVATSQLFAWRRQYGDVSVAKKPSNRKVRPFDCAQGFAAVMVVPDVAPDDQATSEAATPAPEARLEIVLSNGAQLIASGSVVPATLVEAIKAMLAVA
jgi:transposase